LWRNEERGPRLKTKQRKLTQSRRSSDKGKRRKRVVTERKLQAQKTKAGNTDQRGRFIPKQKWDKDQSLANPQRNGFKNRKQRKTKPAALNRIPFPRKEKDRSVSYKQGGERRQAQPKWKKTCLERENSTSAKEWTNQQKGGQQ